MYKIFCYARVYSNTERFLQGKRKMAFSISDLEKMHQSQSTLSLPLQKGSEIPEKLFPGILEISPKTLSDQIRLPDLS
jgi:hypothetical protein